MRAPALLGLLGLLVALPAGAVEQVRISVGEGLSSVEISGKALAQAPWGDEEEGFKPLKRNKVVVTLKQGKVALDGKAVATGLRLRATGLIQVKGFAVRGTVDIKAEREGLLVVNAIPLEDYLAAVLGGEMPPGFPEEALKAQAVAARTYAISRKLDQYGKPYHLGSTVLSQVYGGAGREDPRTKVAVEATRGLVLTYDLAPIEAYFHASCGGRTETGRSALGRDLPYLQSVDCPCGHDPKAHWSLSLPARTVEKDFHIDPSKLRVSVRSRSGRVVKLEDGERQVDAVTFRRVLGYDQVKSLEFNLAREGSSFKLTGKGSGHGAGLCQYGAKYLAEQGESYDKILAHYYPGTELQRMY